MWTIKEEDKRNIVKKVNLRRSSRISRLERIHNKGIRNVMQASETIIDSIDIISLVWFDNLFSMEDFRWFK